MKKMLVNMSEPGECRIAVMSGPNLEEFYIERTANAPIVGNIYKGIVRNVEPALQAAFVDFGKEKSGFLHVTELSEKPSGRGREAKEGGKEGGKEKRPEKERSIQSVLKRGQEVTVQVIREPIDHKGASLSMRVSLPGRYLVLMPGFDKVGVSRKITDVRERDKLREALAALKPPQGMGFIVRTAGIDRTKDDLAHDLKYLLRLWDTVAKRAKRLKAPAALYEESDLVIRVIRDIFSSDVESIVVDTPEGEREVKEFLRTVMPRYQSRVKLHTEKAPLFHHYRIEQAVEAIFEPKVALPSGGSLVIEQTEALVAIDVNSGKFTRESDAEETGYRTNLEAAAEIPKQLRLRDLGGLVICDFIDMDSESHVREVENLFESEMKKDRARCRFTRMSRFGVIEITRQKIRAGAERMSHESCPACQGTGRVKTAESTALKALRDARVALLSEKASRVQIRCAGRDAQHLLNAKRKVLSELETGSGKQIRVVMDAGLAPGTYLISALDKEGKAV